MEALNDQDRVPNSKKENNAKSSSAIEALSDEDRVLDYGGLGNFSLSGFEMILTRYVSTYIITYYLPSGTYVDQLTSLQPTTFPQVHM